MRVCADGLRARLAQSSSTRETPGEASGWASCGPCSTRKRAYMSAAAGWSASIAIHPNSRAMAAASGDVRSIVGHVSFAAAIAVR